MFIVLNPGCNVRTDPLTIGVWYAVVDVVFELKEQSFR